MTEQPSIRADVQAAIERVLDATGLPALGNDFDTSKLADLLDPASAKRTLINIAKDQRRPAHAKERRKHFERAAKLAGELHELLTADRFQHLEIWNCLKGLKEGSGFPIGEWEGDPWEKDEESTHFIDSPPEDKLPRQIGSYHATVNGIARLHDRLNTFVEVHGDEPFMDPAGFSHAEMLIVGPILSSFNMLTRRDRTASPQRSRDPETGAPGGPFVRYAVQVMKELGSVVSAETIMTAIRKKNASGRNGGKSD